MLLCQPEAEDTSPRMPHNKDSRPLETSAEIIRHFQCVLLHLRNRHASTLDFSVIRGVGLPCSALIPLNYGEVLFPGTLERARQRNKSNAGTAVDKQKYGIVGILAPYLNPLVDPADSHPLEAVDAFG